ncbi:unnamed protein product, partial [Allacma fusca]
MRLNKMD